MHAAGSNKQLRRRRYNIQQEEYARGNSATAPQFWLHPKYNNEKIKHKQKKYNFKSFACTSRSSNIAVLNILKLVVLIRSLKYTLIKKSLNFSISVLVFRVYLLLSVWLFHLGAFLYRNGGDGREAI